MSTAVGRMRDGLSEYLLIKLANKNPDVEAGVRALVRDSVGLNSLNHAVALLSTAKSETYLLSVEASLQTIINTVRALHDSGSPNMDDKKTSLYLFTLQSLIDNLSEWQFVNQKPNHFVPTIKQKYNAVVSRGRSVGLDEQVIHDSCYTAQYQDDSRPVLQEFLFLDEQGIDDTESYIKQYRLNTNKKLGSSVSVNQSGLKPLNKSSTKKRVDSENNKPAHPKRTNAVILESVMETIRERTGLAQLSFQYMVCHLTELAAQVCDIMHTNNYNSVIGILEAMLHRVLVTAHGVQHGVQQLSQRSAAALEKVTTVIKQKINTTVLSVRYVVENFTQLFYVVGNVIKVNDQNTIAYIIEQIMQRSLGNTAQPAVVAPERSQW